MILPLPAKVSCIASSSLRSLISLSCFLRRIVGSSWMLTVARLLTLIILEANLRVEMVSSRCFCSGQILATITVLQLPPIESFSKLVNLLYLYGICVLCLSLKATTTYSRNESDLLIYCASFNYFPSEPVFFVLSEPARSTRLIFEKITFSDDSTLDRISSKIVYIQCDLVEYLFSLCYETVLFVSPSKRTPRASSSVLQIF